MAVDAFLFIRKKHAPRRGFPPCVHTVKTFFNAAAAKNATRRVPFYFIFRILIHLFYLASLTMTG